MMRGWTPLFATVAALVAVTPARAQPAIGNADAPRVEADADDDDEPQPMAQQPMPPMMQQPLSPSPMIAPTTLTCCADPRPSERHLLVKLSVGPTYRRAFGDDFFAVMPELELGGQTHDFSVGARLTASFGGTRVGLPYQTLSVGPSFMFRLSPRMMLGFGASFGFFAYERASATALTDSTVWSPSLGLTVGTTIDLVRSRSGGALYADARVAFDWIATLHGGFLDGASIAPSLSLGWRL